MVKSGGQLLGLASQLWVPGSAGMHGCPLLSFCPITLLQLSMMSMQMGGKLRKEQIGTLFVQAGLLHGGATQFFGMVYTFFPLPSPILKVEEHKRIQNALSLIHINSPLIFSSKRASQLFEPMCLTFLNW